MTDLPTLRMAQAYMMTECKSLQKMPATPSYLKLSTQTVWLVSDNVQMLASMLSANQGAEKLGQHPLELVTEDAVDDEVDRTVDGDQEIVGLGESVVNTAKVLKF